MPDNTRIVIFVHGWSVRSTNTYGELPRRLVREAERAASLHLDVRHVWLGKYVSFRDEVEMEDVARGFEYALQKELGGEIRSGQRFICITHSTGGPVVRDWWNRFCLKESESRPCPMSHLVMLAPANFGSTLAQLGKSRLSRVKCWFEGVEPGTGLLDWLELGSPESWELNTSWISSSESIQGGAPVFVFTLTGQSIDRSLYDHLNSYTDEDGSDGVVRSASANLNATYIRLEQTPQAPNVDPASQNLSMPLMMRDSPRRAPCTAFALIEGRSHSGVDMGILRSVRDDNSPHPTLDAILQCISVSTPEEYLSLANQFTAQNQSLREKERVEIYRQRFLPDSVFIHDMHSMIIFRIRDDRGHVVSDFDLKLTAGRGDRVSSDLLPTGFFLDRQKNRRESGTLTYYLSYDAMAGCPAIVDPRDPEKRKLLRDPLPGTERLGLEIVARPDGGFAHYVPATLVAATEVLEHFIRPDSTTLIDIVLRRVVREGVFLLTSDLDAEDFTDQPPGEPIA
jgi:hypothetical protein